MVTDVQGRRVQEQLQDKGAQGHKPQKNKWSREKFIAKECWDSKRDRQRGYRDRYTERG